MLVVTIKEESGTMNRVVGIVDGNEKKEKMLIISSCKKLPDYIRRIDENERARDLSVHCLYSYIVCYCSCIQWCTMASVCRRCPAREREREREREKVEMREGERV